MGESVTSFSEGDRKSLQFRPAVLLSSKRRIKKSCNYLGAWGMIRRIHKSSDVCDITLSSSTNSTYQLCVSQASASFRSFVQIFSP